VRKSRYSDEQIAQALRQAELGTPIAEVTRKLGISEPRSTSGTSASAKFGTPEIRELRQLREENTKLQQVVADLTLDRAVLQDVLKKSGEAGAPSGGATGGAQHLEAERTPGLRDSGR
jgi:putative transposase